MRVEVVRDRRMAAPVEIFGRCHEDTAVGRQPTRHEGRVVEVRITDGHVERAFGQIDDAVGDAHVGPEIGIAP